MMATSNAPAPVAIRYQCPICGEGYGTYEEAVACRDTEIDNSPWFRYEFRLVRERP